MKLSPSVLPKCVDTLTLRGQGGYTAPNIQYTDNAGILYIHTYIKSYTLYMTCPVHSTCLIKSRSHELIVLHCTDRLLLM